MHPEMESPAALSGADGASIGKRDNAHDAAATEGAQGAKHRGKDFTKQQIIWTRQVRDDLRLPDLAVRIADALAFDYMNEEKGKAWPSEALLCKRVGKSPKTVNAVIDKLIERGHLIKFPGGGRGKSNRYSWVIKPENYGKNAGVLEEETTAFSKEFTDEKPRQKRAANSGSFGAKTTAKMPEEPSEENRLIEPEGGRALGRAPANSRVGVVDDVVFVGDEEDQTQEQKRVGSALEGPPDASAADRSPASDHQCFAADLTTDGEAGAASVWDDFGEDAEPDARSLALDALIAAHTDYSPVPYSSSDAMWAADWTTTFVEGADNASFRASAREGAEAAFREAKADGGRKAAAAWWSRHLAALVAYAEATDHSKEAALTGAAAYSASIRDMIAMRENANG